MSKKRANGKGNIRKRKDGRWEGRYTAGYPTSAFTTSATHKSSLRQRIFICYIE